MKAPRFPHVANGLCLFMGPMCIALAAGNYQDHANLVAALAGFPPVSPGLAPWVAAWIWAAQFVFGFFILAPPYRRFASLGLAGMFLSFLTVSLDRLSAGGAVAASFYTKYDPLAANAGACAARDALFLTAAVVIYLCYFPRLEAQRATDTADDALSRST